LGCDVPILLGLPLIFDIRCAKVTPHSPSEHLEPISPPSVFVYLCFPSPPLIFLSDDSIVPPLLVFIYSGSDLEFLRLGFPSRSPPPQPKPLSHEI